MKVLRIYDHRGELKKEFPIYVEGQDFKWLASVPEPIWLGTIALEEAGKEPEAEPTPEVVVAEPELEVETTDLGVIEIETPIVAQVAKHLEKKEVKDEPKKVHRKRSGVKGTFSPGNSKSAEIVRQDDSPGNANQGD